MSNLSVSGQIIQLLRQSLTQWLVSESRVTWWYTSYRVERTRSRSQPASEPLTHSVIQWPLITIVFYQTLLVTHDLQVWHLLLVSGELFLSVQEIRCDEVVTNNTWLVFCTCSDKHKDKYCHSHAFLWCGKLASRSSRSNWAFLTPLCLSAILTLVTFHDLWL